jgi:hypothetical protein
MARIAFFVDGFSLYHALDYCSTDPNHYKYRKYKWLNLRKLASLFVGQRDALGEVL